MVEKYKCAIVQILYIIHFQPKFVADDYRMIIFLCWAQLPRDFKEILRKKENFSPSIMRLQISHQGKLNNIEESFYNFCQCAAKQHLCRQLFSHDENGCRIGRKWGLQTVIHKQSARP